MKKQDHSYIVEYVTVGRSLKVTAFDPATLKEVSIIGDPNASRRDLANLAVRKLNYVLNKKEN